MFDRLVEDFCQFDDFCQGFYPHWEAQLLAEGSAPCKKRGPEAGLADSEIMTILVLYHSSHFKNFKTFYEGIVLALLRPAFPKAPCYARFIALTSHVWVPLTMFLLSRMGRKSGLYYIDSTALAVCHNRRIPRHKVFAGLAARGKSSTGWFFGFKLHVVINHRGELLAIRLTPGNVDDRKPVPKLCQSLFGKLFGDKGYLAKWLSEMLAEQDVHLITKVRKNMKPIELTPFDQALLRQRSLIETVFDELKNLCQIEHTRHRSLLNFVVNLMAGVVAYCLAPNKPRL